MERTNFSTSDPAVAQAAISEMYSSYRPRVGGSTETFAFDVSRISAGDMHADRVVYSQSLTATLDPLERLLFVFPTSGCFIIGRDAMENRLGVGDAGMFPVGVPVDVSVSPVRAEFLSLPLAAAEEAAAEQGQGGGLRFTGMTPVSPAMDRYWRSTVGFVSHQMESPDSPLSEPLLRAETRALLGAAAVRTFPNTTMDADETPRRERAGHAALRQAVAFIDAHADRALTLDEVACAAGTAPHALANAFTHRYGTGPLGYLHRVRMERVHRGLRSGDTTVPRVAPRWGFAESDGPSAAYGEGYGGTPGLILPN